MTENNKFIWNYTSDLWHDYSFALKTNNYSRFNTSVPIFEVLRKMAGEHVVDIRRFPGELITLLVNYGLIIPMPDFKDVFFDIPYNKQLLEMIPYKEKNLPVVFPDNNFIINPELYFEADSVPAVVTKLTYCLKNEPYFKPGATRLWIREPFTCVMLPFSPDAEILPLLKRVISGVIKPADLPGDIFSLLVHTGFLLPSDYRQDILRRKEELRQVSENLRRDKYAVLRKMLSPGQLAAIRIYYRQLSARELFKTGDTQVEKRDHIINEGIARLLHFQTLQPIQAVIPEQVKPSYCYLARYRPGAVLKKHVDREQCIWNMSLVFDMEPEFDCTESWPVYLEIDGKSHEVRLEMGDGVIYKGAEIPHWRDKLPANNYTTVCFYHFVPASFNGKLF